MTSLNRTLSVSLCLASALILSGCDTRSGDAQAKQQPAAAQPEAPAAQDPTLAAADKDDGVVKPLTAEDREKMKNAVHVAPTDPALLSTAAELSYTAEAPHDHAAHDANDAKPAQADLTKPPVAATPVDPAAFLVKAEKPEFDMGEIATNDTKTVPLKLINTADKPMTIVSSRGTCGCTAIKLPPNTIIPANQTLDVDIQLQGGQAPGPIRGKKIIFNVEGQPELEVSIIAQAVSYVTVEPTMLDPETMPEGKTILKSVDGAAFKIVSMQPALITEFPGEAKTEHEVALDWAKFRELGVQREVTFFVDHPKCQRVTGKINWKPEEFANMKGQVPPNKGEVRPLAPDPDSIIAAAIKEGNAALVLEKVQGGLDVNHSDSSGMSLLGQAAKAGNVAIMQALLSTGASLDSTDKVGRTPLMWAAQSKNTDAVRTLLDAGASVTTRDSIGGTALSWAAGMGDAATVQELIDAGADVEIVGAVTGWTPLIWAAGFGEAESIEPLVKAGANIEVGDFIQGATPLIHAARTGKVEGVKALLKAGANIETSDKMGNTALLAAAGNSGGTADKVQALIEAGADIHAKDSRGYNALDLAKKRTDLRAAEVIAVLEPLLATAEKPAEPAPAAPETPTNPGH